MSLTTRKILVLAVLGLVLLAANAWDVIHWLEAHNLIDHARHIGEHFLTGTAIAVILAMLVLIAPQRHRET